MNIDTSKLEDCYDTLIKNLIPKSSWIDPLLVKAIIKQESMFNPIAVSTMGARGLGQIMPDTAAWLGDKSNGFDIYKNIQNIIAMLTYLHKIFMDKSITMDDAIQFVLASYNAGPGNIEKAMSVAQLAGANYLKWEEVEPFLQDVTGHHSVETINYVSNVVRFFQQYKGGLTT